jgi:glucosamine--fructose-6-phosphate aminotransferase (isomerizing)
MTMLTPFEEDILEQPEALRRLIEPTHQYELDELASREWDRIVFTGMGSSHFASIPSWRGLSAAGRTTLIVDAGQLLDTPGLLTDKSLLIATSQSGASGEVVELLNRIDAGDIKAGFVAGITASGGSALALQSDLYLPLLSGDEATVSTKSYLNTLAVHRRVVAAFIGEDPGSVSAEIAAAADFVDDQLSQGVDEVLADRILAPGRPRLAAIGKRDDAATALYAGLITKESSKVAIEGFVGGQFRHGPFELAGAGMTAFLYGARAESDDDTLERLAVDLVDTGATVVLVGDLRIPNAITLTTPASGGLAGLSTGAVVAELIAVDLARANGVEPGAFAFGSKITTRL